MHSATRSLLLAVMISGFNSLTISLPSRSQILMVEPVATHNQYLNRLEKIKWLFKQSTQLTTNFSRKTKSNVPVGWEAHRIDDFLVVQSVQMLVFVQVPQHHLVVFATGSAQGTVRRDGHTVQISRMALIIAQLLAVGQIPNLDLFVPASRHDHWLFLVSRQETDAWHPIVVSVDGVFALS